LQRKHAFTEKAEHISDNIGDHRSYQDTFEQNDHPAPEVEKIESDYADADSSVSHKFSSHTDFPLQKVCTVFSRRCQQITTENNSLTNMDNSHEHINQESAVPWNSSNLSDTKIRKDISEEVHHNSTHSSAEYDSFSHTGSKRDISKSENGSHFSSRRGTFHSDARSERKKFSVDNSRLTSHSMSKEPVFRHSHQRDEYEYKAYSKHEAERYLHFESDRSGTHSSDHQPHSERWESHDIPRTIHETNISGMLRNSRSGSASWSRTEPGSVEDNAKGRYDVRASSNSRSFGLTETSDRHTNHVIKLADNNPSTYHQTTQVTTDTQLGISKDLGCRTQKQFTGVGKPHYVTETSNVELEPSLKMQKTEQEVNTEMSPCDESTVLNLFEHGGFKRSRRAKIVKLNTETKPSEAKNSANNFDSVRNTNSKLCWEYGHGRIKRLIDSKEIDEDHLPDSKRRALYDITGRECYNYRENDNCSEHEQKYDTARIQLCLGPVNENMMKDYKFTKYENDDIRNGYNTVLEGSHKAKELEREIGSQNIKLNFEEDVICEDDKLPTMENTVEREKIYKLRIKSDSPESNERDRYVARRKQTDYRYHEYIKYRSERKPSDMERKMSRSFRPQYTIKKYYERSCTPFRYNNRCRYD
jgi:hypothetical protein